MFLYKALHIAAAVAPSSRYLLQVYPVYSTAIGVQVHTYVRTHVRTYMYDVVYI